MEGISPATCLSWDETQSPEFLPSPFFARWCWQVFLLCLTDDAHLFMIQNVVREEMILLPRAYQTCALANVTAVFIVHPFQTTYITPSILSTGTRNMESNCFPGSFSTGFILKCQPTFFCLQTQYAHLCSLFFSNNILVKFPRTPDSHFQRQQDKFPTTLLLSEKPQKQKQIIF